MDLKSLRVNKLKMSKKVGGQTLFCGSGRRDYCPADREEAGGLSVQDVEKEEP